MYAFISRNCLYSKNTVVYSVTSTSRPKYNFAYMVIMTRCINENIWP